MAEHGIILRPLAPEIHKYPARYGTLQPTSLCPVVNTPPHMTPLSHHQTRMSSVPCSGYYFASITQCACPDHVAVYR